MQLSLRVLELVKGHLQLSVAENVLNKQPRTSDKRWSSGLRDIVKYADLC
jgi:hypothetical protein